MEGAIDLLEAMRGKKTLALASSSYRDAVDAVLQGLNVADCFSAILSGLDVMAVKPAPDIFLAAAARAGASPQECLVIEDAEKGIIAAHRAGMRSIAIPNVYTRHHDFSKANLICTSLREITLDLIDTIDAS
jgi:HAD superfamily hydrolase (TIGR01509 family)